MRFYTCPTTGEKFLLTGSVDRTLRLWRADPDDKRNFSLVHTLEGHTGSVNTIAVANGTDIVVSGAADGSVKIWRIASLEGFQGELLQTISLKPRFFPLALALTRLQTDADDSPLVLAVAGTTNVIQLYVTESTSANFDLKLSAVLSGHEAWVRSLSFTKDKNSKVGDLLLASASQDKYIRLWRFHRGLVTPSLPQNDDETMIAGLEPTLSNKAHQLQAAGSTYSVTFEALLFGNEDWIYTTAWNPNSERQQLLSASADNTLTIWEQDLVSGVWISAERMGEISVQKGSTTATGSTGGFWVGLWAPDGKSVVSLGRTGSWRLWNYDEAADVWQQSMGITGHVRSVNGVQWERTGGYLMSTSADQTSRLHAQWLRADSSSWHEFSRPQIHGYDLNCIATLGPAQFVSGADEKLLRVFNEPKPVAQILGKLSGFQPTNDDELPDTAQIPVLGLSNQALGDEAPVDVEGNGPDGPEMVHSQGHQALLAESDRPPLEDQLARHTLWPEHEKLYGHGYEISAVVASYDCTLIATACKASSLDHAVIRLYDTSDWHEVRPSLAAHSLTITGLSFSHDDRYLLSVGRDRQWAVFSRSDQDPTTFNLLASNPKGHSRMILDAAWAPATDSSIFATAGRDKTVKIWQREEATFVCRSITPLKTSISAISFYPQTLPNTYVLAVGEDSGEVSIYHIAMDSLEPKHLISVDRRLAPSKTVTQLAWRPSTKADEEEKGQPKFELAVASEDTSMRVYAISNIFS